MQTTTLASGFPEALSNDCLIMDTKSCAKQRETLEDAEGQARTVSCVARMMLIVKENVKNGKCVALCKLLHVMDSNQELLQKNTDRHRNVQTKADFLPEVSVCVCELLSLHKSTVCRMVTCY